MNQSSMLPGVGGDAGGQGQERPSQDLHPFLQFIVDRIRWFVAGGLGVVLLVVAVAGWDWYQQRQFEQARTRLGEIISQNQGKDRLAALKEFRDQASSPFATGAGLLLAQEAMTQGDHQLAEATYAQLAKGAETDLKVVASLGRATALLQLDRADEAKNVLQNVKPVTPQAYQDVLLRQLAFAAESAGDPRTALEAYKDLKEFDIQDAKLMDYKIDSLEAKIQNQPEQ
jgi:predicted negative regulator of RcsB-dependent stress response